MGVAEARAEFLIGLMDRHASRTDRILEVGSRGGDNLATLFQAGYEDLTGIEDDTAKAASFNERHGDIAGRVPVMAGPIDGLVRGFFHESFEIVFTVGFLFDREGDHGWLFPELARICSRRLMSIENEDGGSLRDTYESLGFRQLEAVDLRTKPELQSVFHARVFEMVRPA